MSETTAGNGAPVVERIICLHHAPLSAEVLSEKLPAWRTKIRESYPDSEPIADWTLEVPTHDGTPDFAHVRPELKLRHRFWGPGEDEERTWCIQSLSTAVVFNVRREKTTHGYAELKEKVLGILSNWSQHFDVTRFQGAEVRYVNRLNATLTPQFMGSDGALAIGSAFKLFSNIPVTGYTIVQPYNCTVTLQNLDSPKGKLTVQVIGETEDKAPAAAIHLACTVLPDDKRGFDCPAVGDMLDIAHERVGDAFRHLFTDAALASFGILS